MEAAFPLALGAWNGDDGAVRRDLTWDAMVTVAERLNREAGGLTSHVRASRQRSWLTLTVTEGLEVADNWTEAFEAVRKRRLPRGAWTEIQPVAQAASTVGRFLRERPDLR